MVPYIKYSNGMFSLVQANLPEAVRNNKGLQNSILSSVLLTYSNYNWAGITPNQKFEKLNLHVYNLIQNY